MELLIEKDQIELFEGFYDEAIANLNGIEEKILKTEDIYEIETVQELFRIIHSVKGVSSFLNINNIKRLSHIIENMLDRKRKTQEKVDSDEIDLLLKGIDRLLTMVQDLGQACKAIDENQDIIKISLKDIDFEDIETDIRTLMQKYDNIENVNIVFPNRIKEEFIIEVYDHTENLEKLFIEIEKKPEDIEPYNNIFRCVHSIKGNTGLLLSIIEDEKIKSKHLLNEIHKITTSMESVIQTKRDNKIVLQNDEIDIFLLGIDSIKSIVNSFKAGKNITASVDSILSKINYLNNKQKDIKVNIDKNISGDAKAIAVSYTIAQLLDSVRIELNKLEQEKSVDIDKRVNVLERNFRNFKKIGEKSKNTIIKNEAEKGLGLLISTLNKDVDLDRLIVEFGKIFEVLEEEGNKIKDTEFGKNENKTGDSKKNIDGKMNVIKVPQERIDKLMNLIGELMIKKNNFDDLSKEIMIDYGLGNMAAKIKQIGNEVTKISEELQSTIMSVRMVPLSMVFSRFPRLVRDLSKKLNKKIDIEINGEDTELDKTLVEVIGDPLVHIIRNSIDHGIEIPSERISKGKEETGKIKIKAYSEGNSVIIEITDDGKGIDAEKIKKSALEKKIILENEVEKMNSKQQQMLIFHPGFSTVEKVSDLSGRGVGMDVVKTNIESISGNVYLESEVDKGSTIKLKLPLTLAVNKGIELKINKGYYYISSDNVIEIVRILSNDIITHKNNSLIVIRGETLPLFSLAKILSEDEEYSEELEVLVLSVKGRKVAIKVDKVVGEGQYLIKSLPYILSRSGLFSGAVITGKGEIKLVIDPLKLF